MSSLWSWLRVGSKRGVSAIEYGLLAALISLTIIASVSTLGTNLKGVFNAVTAPFCTTSPNGSRSC
jgi:pilus assembly protein Flp/PilA